MNIILWYLYTFCFSIIAVGNPIVLKLLYKSMDRDGLYELRIDTTKYVWGINNNLSEKFNREEILHFLDVRKLFTRFLCIFLLSVNYLYEYTEQTCYDFMCLNIFLVVFAYILKYNFEQFWSIIHYPFFESGTWLFPYNSLMIRCFPLYFWSKLLGTIFVSFYSVTFSTFIYTYLIK